MTKKCMLCDKPIRAKGFCGSHYNSYLTPKKPYKGGKGWPEGLRRLNQEICMVDGCGGRVTSKNYCQKHYEQIRRTGKLLSPKPTKCMICENKPRIKGFCQKHYELYKRPHKGYIRGEQHHSYKNGNSYFKNHYEVKQNRLRLIKERGAICQDCGKEVIGHLLHQHHEDGNKNNHSDNNIKLLCLKCHAVKRRGKGQIRINNVNLWSIALGMKYEKLHSKLMRLRKQTGLSKMAILGWMIMELHQKDEASI